MPTTSGLQLFDELRLSDAKLPIVFITSLSSSETAIKAMTMGAFDYLLKPLDVAQVRELVGQALEIRRLMSIPVDVPGELVSANDAKSIRSDTLVGSSAQMQEVYKAIGRVAPRDVTVLVRGESGTGKELVARAVYQHSARHDTSSSPSIARRSPMRYWKANCSDMKRARSPAPTGNESASLSNARAVRCSLTRSATCRLWCKARYSASCNRSSSSASAEIRPSRPMFGSLPQRIEISNKWCKKASFAPISTIA